MSDIQRDVGLLEFCEQYGHLCGTQPGQMQFAAGLFGLRERKLIHESTPRMRHAFTPMVDINKYQYTAMQAGALAKSINRKIDELQAIKDRAEWSTLSNGDCDE